MMKQRTFLILLLLLILLSLIGCGGSSGGGSASISGQVADFSYNNLEGVKIDVGGKATAITDYWGEFQTGTFPLGTYKMSFTKDGYWTRSFDVTFSQAGNYGFTDKIRLNKVTDQLGAVEEPSFIRDLSSTEKQLTINANNQVQTLIALLYNTNSSQSDEQTHINISTDTGSSFSATLTNNQNFSASGYVQTDPYQRLREFDRKINQEMKNKGTKPGKKPPTFSAMHAEPQLRFYKFNFDYNNTLSRVTANKKYDGEHCLIYLDNRQNISDSDIRQLGETFDGFYDRMITYFGDLTIDIDQYPKIYILLSELYHNKDGMILGYFSNINEYPKSEQPYSNEKEMLYLTTYTYNSNPQAWLNMIKSTAAHEFQHLINYSCRWENVANFDDYYDLFPTWINEGLSMVAEDIAIAGAEYRHNPELDIRVNTYLKYHLYDSLQAWNGDGLDYGSAYMFMRYFADRCGEDKLRVLNTSSDPYINDYDLASIAGASNFEVLFRDWLTAVILDASGYTTSDPDLADKYLYKTLDLSTYDFPKESQGYINMSTGAGAFIVMPNLESVNRIDLAYNCYSSYNTKLRLIMLPVSGESFSASTIPKIIRLR